MIDRSQASASSAALGRTADWAADWARRCDGLCDVCSLFDLRLPEFSLISATSSAHLTLCNHSV